MLPNNSLFAPRRALEALAKLLRDPDDLPQVFALIESLSGSTLERLWRRLGASSAGRRLLRDRPDIGKILGDRAALARLPEGSLGRAYLAFMEAEGITAEGIVAASEEGTEGRRAQNAGDDRAYVHQRMRDTHDLWHAVTGYHGDVLGEVALLGFILAQTRNPAIAVLVGAALLRTGRQPGARQLIFDGFRRGRRAAWLVDTEWEALLASPVDEVRAELGIDAPPVYKEIRSSEIKARMAA